MTDTAARRAFTLVELLVSVSIIVLLLGMLFAGTQTIYENFRRTTTQQTFRNIGAAIDQFAEINPLRSFYDQPGRLGGAARTFGSFPPYAVRDAATSPNSVAGIIEPVGQSFVTFEQRISRDLSGTLGPPPAGWAGWIDTVDGPDVNRADPVYLADGDNRALYAYLRAFNPAGLRQVPAAAIRPLANTEDELARPITREAIRLPGSSSAGSSAAQYPGSSSAPDAANWAELQGFYDAWGVPIDYMVYVKVEPGVRIEFGPPFVGWRVTDRQWALRSHGVARDEYESRVRQVGGVWDDHRGADYDGIYSSALPTPYAGPKPHPVPPVPMPDPPGLILNAADTNQAQAGWVRLRAAGEWQSYNYLPGVPFQ